MQRFDDEILPVAHGRRFDDWNWHDMTEEYSRYAQTTYDDYDVDMALLYCHDDDWPAFDMSNVKCDFDIGWVISDSSNGSIDVWCSRMEDDFLVNDALAYANDAHPQDVEDAMAWIEAEICRDVG